MEDNKSLKVRNDNYFQIGGWMINRLNLKGNTLMIYAIIYGFSQDGESSFNGSRQYLCDFTGATKRTIDASLNELLEKNLIIKVSEKINDVVHNRYKINLDVLNCSSGANFALGGVEIAPNNKEYNIDIKESIINNNTKEIFEKIFECWNQKKIVVHRNIEDFKTKIKNALKEHTADEIMLAIEHYSIVLNDSSYFYKYKWNLNDFLGREKGYTEFLDNGSKWLNYLDFKNKKVNPYKPNEMSRETAYPDFDDVGYIR